MVLFHKTGGTEATQHGYQRCAQRQKTPKALSTQAQDSVGPTRQQCTWGIAAACGLVGGPCWPSSAVPAPMQACLGQRGDQYMRSSACPHAIPYLVCQLHPGGTCAQPIASKQHVRDGMQPPLVAQSKPALTVSSPTTLSVSASSPADSALSVRRHFPPPPVQYQRALTTRQSIRDQPGAWLPSSGTEVS